MIWWLLLIVFLLAAAFVTAPVRVELSYTHSDDAVDSAVGDVLNIHVRALYFLRYTRRVALQDTGVRADRLSADTVRDFLGCARRAISHVLEELPVIRRLLGAFEIRDMVWTTTIGAPFAPDTAILCGMAWTAKSALVGVASQIFTVVHAPRMAVTPQFDRPALSSTASCIVATRLGKATYAGWRLFLLVKKALVTVAKEGVHAGSSDSIAHADGHGEP